MRPASLPLRQTCLLSRIVSDCLFVVSSSFERHLVRQPQDAPNRARARRDRGRGRGRHPAWPLQPRAVAVAGLHPGRGRTRALGRAAAQRAVADQQRRGLRGGGARGRSGSATSRAARGRRSSSERISNVAGCEGAALEFGADQQRRGLRGGRARVWRRARASRAPGGRAPESHSRAPSAERVFTRAVDELERSGVRQLNQRERISNVAGCEGN